MNNRALLLIDFQKGIGNNKQKLYRLPEVIRKVNQRIAIYRQHCAPIIVIQHEDNDLPFKSEKWQVIDMLDTQPTDFFVRKTHANSFYKTNLNEILVDLNIHSLEISGVQTEFCVDTTIRVAHGLGYSCFMARGTTTTLDNNNLTAQQIIKHHESIWDGRFLSFLS